MRIAAHIVRHATRVLPPSRREWADAMLAELEHLPRGASALRWACGCLLACYTERLRLMPSTAPTFPVSRWVLMLEMLIGFAPPTWVFLALTYDAIVSFDPGRPPAPTLLHQWLLYCSCTLLGPLGLILAGRLVLLGRPVIGRIAAIALGTLAAWTAVAYAGQWLLEPHSMVGSFGWRELVLFALLPALAAAHLILIDTRARSWSVAEAR